MLPKITKFKKSGRPIAAIIAQIEMWRRNIALCTKIRDFRLSADLRYEDIRLLIPQQTVHK